MPIREVKETIEPRPITPLFLVPEFVSGLLNLRGEVVAVLDLGLLLGLGRTQATPDTRIVILRGGRPGRPPTAGLIVDRLTEVRAVDAAEVRPVPPTVPGDAAGYLRGVVRDAGRLVLLLHLDAVLADEQLQSHRRTRTA